MSINLSALMKQRYDTAANWTAQNPTLLAGEIGIESDTKKWKVGTGATAWTSLTYAIGGTYPIVNADIAAGAEIAVSKLADGSARQLLQTDAAGTGVEWTSDVSIPGALSVTGNVNIDGGTLYVDAVNNRVGIGTTPSAAFHVSNLSGGTPTTFIENAASTGDALAGVRFLTHNGTSSTGQADIFATNNAWSYRNYGSNALVMNATGTGGAHLMASNASGVIKFSVGGDATGQERMRLTSTGLGIGITNPGGTLDIKAAASTHPLIVQGPSSEFARIDSSGRLLVGTSSSLVSTSLVQVAGTNYPAMSVNSFGTSSNPEYIFRSARGTQSSPTVSVNDDKLGAIYFQGYDGVEYLGGAKIEAFVDGAVTGGGTDDLPGRLVFSTTADGAASPLPQATITNGGLFYIGTTDGSNPSVGDKGFLKVYGRSDRSSFFAQGYSQTVSYFNRTTNDGTLLEFLQDGTTEGTISVSGTTVSYNGAHLSRWSQLPNGATREEILRGTVLSNIDEMCQWGEEDNEQLNRMKVSDVEGDKNVSGVFQCWDDDDDTYTDDFYCAMTGDFIIRIAEGVTVERGDLLMSAGDGTAKPQDDDIIRSKTIAKVTSTNVSCTYEDGSYCVPCVLMAC